MNRIDQELIVAAKENNLAEVSRLLRAGADVNYRALHKNGFTPLHWACFWGHVHVVVELLKNGADIESKNGNGFTPLYYACAHGDNGHVAVVIELLSRGANTEVKDPFGNTLLHIASWQDHIAVVQALLIGGANILAVNNQGLLPVHRAVNGRNSAVSKCLLQHFYATRRLPLHELLHDLTGIVNPGVNDNPPLRFALDQNVLGTDDVVEIVKFLVERNPGLLSSRNQDGLLPLHLACRRGDSFPIVQSLVNLYKASVKSLTPQGDLPLFLACEMPETCLDTIFLLMKLYPDLVY
jgi:ankyrin repeat protein